MKEITLTQGKVALVDDSDFEQLSKVKWRARKQTKRDVWYAFRTLNQNGKKITVLMHRVILSGVPRIDHRDCDGLNNQRDNLRPATCSQNNANARKIRKPVSSKFKGVFRRSGRQGWTATIRVMGKCRFLGSFHDEIEAAVAYDEAARKSFGEFARPNFPP